jgi:aldehyde dehydrogenase (NAD+)
MTLTVRQHRDAAALKDGLLLVDGQWRQARAGRTCTHHPATGEAVGDFAVAVAVVEDVDDAVRAARRAFDESPWPTIRAELKTMLLPLTDELM